MVSFEWALLLVLSVLWGGCFFFVEVAVKELPPRTILVTRVTLGVCTVLAVGRLMGLRLPTDRGLWVSFFLRLLNNVVSFTLSSGARPTSPAGSHPS